MNFVSSFFLCYPSATSLSRSAVQDAIGGKSQLTSIVSSILLLFVLLFIGPVFYALPSVSYFFANFKNLIPFSPVCPCCNHHRGPERNVHAIHRIEGSLAVFFLGFRMNSCSTSNVINYHVYYTGNMVDRFYWNGLHRCGIWVIAGYRILHFGDHVAHPESQIPHYRAN